MCDTIADRLVEGTRAMLEYEQLQHSGFMSSTIGPLPINSQGMRKAVDKIAELQETIRLYQKGKSDMKYHEKAASVEAVQWTAKNTPSVAKFLAQHDHCIFCDPDGTEHICIAAGVNGDVVFLDVGDYIVKTRDGEYYAYSKRDFEEVYER